MTPGMRRDRIDAELGEHHVAEWTETTKYCGEVLMRFHGRHWLKVNRERMKDTERRAA